MADSGAARGVPRRALFRAVLHQPIDPGMVLSRSSGRVALSVVCAVEFRLARRANYFSTYFRTAIRAQDAFKPMVVRVRCIGPGTGNMWGVWVAKSRFLRPNRTRV